MPEPDPVAELDQARRLGGGRGVGTDAQSLRGAPQQRNVPDGFRGRDQQELPGRRGQGPQLGDEAPLEAAGQGRGAARTGSGPEGQLGRCQRSRQLQEGERVALGLGQDAVTDPGIEGAGHRRLQQRGRIVDSQPAHPELGEPGQLGLLVGLADREDQAHRFGGEPAGHELQRLGRGLVQPLRVVHDADQGLLLGHLGQEGQHRQAQQEAVWHRARLQAEYRAERLALRDRQRADPVQVGAAQLVQAGVRELQLRLDTRRPANPASLCAVDQELEQGGLADPGLATQDQNLAAARLHRRYQAAQGIAFFSPPPQPRPEPAIGHASPPNGADAHLQRPKSTLHQSYTGSYARQGSATSNHPDVHPGPSRVRAPANWRIRPPRGPGPVPRRPESAGRSQTST